MRHFEFKLIICECLAIPKNFYLVHYYEMAEK